MFNWTTLKTLSSVLLCLPLLHLAIQLCDTVATFSNPSPDVWHDQLQKIIAQDQVSRLPIAPILVTGGKSVLLWNSLPEALGSRPTLIRTPGEASLEDLSYHYERLIGYYRPSVLVIQPAFSDLHFRSRKSPAEFGQALENLLSMNISLGATSRRYVVIPVKTLLHLDDSSRIEAIAEVARELARKLPNTAVLDPNPLLLGPDGRPDPGFFRFGGVFLNEHGYKVMTEMLRERLMLDGILSASI